MLETKYYRDMNINYLVLKDSKRPALSRYQQKMIVENDIPGLLRVSQRHIDGDIYFYYEINSLQTVNAMFERRKMDKTMFVRLLSGLINVLKGINNYLLGNEGLLLNPEFIFLNWEKEEVFFVFFPYENEAASEQIKQLFEYLVRIIDHHDERLTDKIYDLCKLTERKILSVDDLEYHLLELSFSQMEESAADKNESGPETMTVEIAEQEESTVYTMPENANGENDDKKMQNVKFLILSLISAAGVIFTTIYQRVFVLTARELLLTWILLVVFATFFLLAGLVYIFLLYRLKNASGSEALYKHARYFPAGTDYFQPATDEPIAAYCGDTIFLSEEAKEDKLYGIGRGNRNIIDLACFPFTIGKLADNADFCLKEASISRVHAKFSKYDNDVLMTDLNSTNGTYRNGLRLEPNETVAIEAGDEIRLGKLKFYYR